MTGTAGSSNSLAFNCHHLMASPRGCVACRCRCNCVQSLVSAANHILWKCHRGLNAQQHTQVWTASTHSSTPCTVLERLMTGERDWTGVRFGISRFNTHLENENGGLHNRAGGRSNVNSLIGKLALRRLGCDVAQISRDKVSVILISKGRIWRLLSW